MNNLIPNHIAIIPDGNGRWATSRGLSRTQGHVAGTNTILKLTEHIFKKGIKVFSVYAFSSENFKRSKEEVEFLMNLFVKVFKTKLKKLKSNNIKVIFSGRKEGLPSKVINAMEKLEIETNNNEYIFNICLNYGGQNEIVDVIQRIVKDKIDVDTLDSEQLKKYFYHELPDIDFVIRTSGEQRISNFMLYQLAYAELFFTNTYWPDFSIQEFDNILDEYQNRDRRFGGIKK